MPTDTDNRDPVSTITGLEDQIKNLKTRIGELMEEIGRLRTGKDAIQKQLDEIGRILWHMH